MKQSNDPRTTQLSYTKLSLVKHFLRGSLHFFVLSILSSFAVTLLEMVIPQIIRASVDSVIGSEPFSFPTMVTQKIDALGGAPFFRDHFGYIALIVIIIAGLAAVFKYFNNLFNTKGSERLMQTMRDQLFAHVQKLPFAWHMKNQTGDIIQPLQPVTPISSFFSEATQTASSAACTLRAPAAIPQLPSPITIFISALPLPLSYGQSHAPFPE